MTSDPTPGAADALETEIRRALQAEALACEPPADLAERTLAAAHASVGAGPSGRRGRSTRAPALVALGAAAAIVAFFTVGRLATGPSLPSDRPAARTADAPAVAREGSAGTSAVPPPSTEGQTAPESDSMTTGRMAAPVPFGPRIARTASLEVRVEKGRFDERWRQAEAVAGRHGGYVTASSAQEVEDRLARGTLTLQVPADKLQGALDELRGLGTPVESTSSASDVSGQVVDYDARLRAAQANEAALLDLARQARSVEDHLAIRPRLEQARREIETLQGQRAALQARVDMATITASLYEPGAAPSTPKPDGRVGEAWDQARAAAAATVAGMIVVAGYAGPIALLAGAGWAVAAAARRRRALRFW